MKRTLLRASLATPIVLLALAATLTQTSALAQSSYSYRDLGTLGGTYSTPNGVNNAGQVVGRSRLASGASDHGFFWSLGTGIVDIGTLGGVSSVAWGINNVGDVVGNATDASGAGHAVLWNTTTRTLADLNAYLLPADAANWVLTNASKVNDNRQVIGAGNVTVGGATSSHGYLLDLNTGALTDLGALSPHGMNNLVPAQVVGQVVANNASIGYAYPGSFPLVSLSPLVSATCINDAGGVGGYLFSGHAAYRSPSGVITDLGSWGGTYPVASVAGINNANPAMTVGDSYYQQNGRVLTHRAFRWVVGSSGGLQNLNSLTPNLGKKNPWILIFARSVSDTGYIVCAADPAGYETGSTHAFLLTPQ